MYYVFAILFDKPLPIAQGPVIEHPQNDGSPVPLKIEVVGIGIPKEPSYRTTDHNQKV